MAENQDKNTGFITEDKVNTVSQGNFRKDSNFKNALTKPYTIIAIAAGIVVVIIILVMVASNGTKAPTANTSFITDTWTAKGNNDNWSTASNWSNGVPKDNYKLVFDTSAKPTSFSPSESNDNLSNLSFYSVSFMSSSKTAEFTPFDITGNPVNIAGGGISINTNSDISIKKVILDSNQKIVGRDNPPSVINLGLDLNGYALSTQNTVIELQNLSSNGMLNVNAGELEFTSTNKANNSFSGQIVVGPLSQMLLSPIGLSHLLGTGSIDIQNGAQLLLRLSAEATIPNNITLGNGSSSIRPVIRGATDVLTSSSNKTVTLTLSGTITLDNDVFINGGEDSGLIPIAYSLKHKPSGKHVLIPENSNTKVIE